MSFIADHILNHLKQVDPDLGKVIELVGPCEISNYSGKSLFEAISRIVIYQQLAGHAAATIHGRFCGLFKNDFPTANSAVASKIELMRTAGLSLAKARSVNHMSELINKGQIMDESELSCLSDSKVIEELVKIKGVGPWSAKIALMFWLGREDVFAENDLGLKKGIQKIYALDQMPTESQSKSYAKKWQPYRTYASWYLWRSLEV